MRLKTSTRLFLIIIPAWKKATRHCFPNGFDAQKADCLILSVALRYKTEDKNPILLTSDNLLQSKALGLGITTIRCKIFFPKEDDRKFTNKYDKNMVLNEKLFGGESCSATQKAQG